MTNADRAREGCPTCDGYGYYRTTKNDPRGREPCPECARVAALLAEARRDALAERVKDRCIEFDTKEARDRVLNSFAAALSTPESREEED